MFWAPNGSSILNIYLMALDHLKAHLVAKGYTQQSSLDFHDTFNPVLKAYTVWVVLSLAVSNNWPLHQLNVNNTFLNGLL